MYRSHSARARWSSGAEKLLSNRFFAQISGESTAAFAAYHKANASFSQALKAYKRSGKSKGPGRSKGLAQLPDKITVVEKQKERAPKTNRVQQCTEKAGNAG